MTAFPTALAAACLLMTVSSTVTHAVEVSELCSHDVEGSYVGDFDSTTVARLNLICVDEG